MQAVLEVRLLKAAALALRGKHPTGQTELRTLVAVAVEAAQVPPTCLATAVQES